MNLGSYNIDDYLTFSCNTHTPSTGAATDADSAPTYRVYEDETATPLLTGTMALLDGSNTAGFYSEQIQLTNANGFERGKSYNIYISATVGGIVGTTGRFFQIGAAVNSIWWKDGVIPTPNATGRPLVDQTHRLGVLHTTAEATVNDINRFAHTGTAQAGGASTITLAAGANANNDFYNGALVRIIAGTGIYQRRWITDYVGATKVATVDSAWITQPDNTSEYEVL